MPRLHNAMMPHSVANFCISMDSVYVGIMSDWQVKYPSVSGIDDVPRSHAYPCISCCRTPSQDCVHIRGA